MKNFLIVVLALGLAAAAFLTRPDREEFDRFVDARERAGATNTFTAFFKSRTAADKKAAAEAAGDVEFKDFFLWTVVKKDGKTLYTGVFDRWIDNQKVREIIPS
jgi:hypothetical protein